jgi:hypothetical protein
MARSIIAMLPPKLSRCLYNPSGKECEMPISSEDMPAYTYGTGKVSASSISLKEFEDLKQSVGLTADDERFLQKAGGVLEGQRKQIVAHWRSGIIASIPNLARHSRSPNGEPLPAYLAQSNLRFEQWILDTCFRPYDQDWLNYQQEIALRHTSLLKNQADNVESTPFVPFRDIIAFVAVLNDTIKPYLANKGDSAGDVDAMHGAWCRSLQLQMALWSRVYMDLAKTKNEW